MHRLTVYATRGLSWRAGYFKSEKRWTGNPPLLYEVNPVVKDVILLNKRQKHQKLRWGFNFEV